MEIIRKKVNLYPFKSHINGILPFIGDGDTNFNGYVYDLTGKTICGWSGNNDGVIRTTEMMRRYNVLLDILRNSIHLKRLSNFNDCGIQSDDVYNKFYLNFRFKGTTDDFIFNTNLGVYNENDFTISENGRYYINKNNEFDCDYVILVSNEDWELYTQYGGLDFVKAVNEVIYKNEASGLTFNKTPYIPIPLLLTCSYADNGLMSLYYDWYSDYTYDDISEPDYFEGISGLTSSIVSVTDKGIELESKLRTLRLPNYFTDDNGVVYDAMFDTFENSEGGKFFKAIYHARPSVSSGMTLYREFENGEEEVISSTDEVKPYPVSDNAYYVVGPEEEPTVDVIAVGTGITEDGIRYTVYRETTACEKYKWCEVIPYDGTNLKCGDGENILPYEPGSDERKYRTLTVFESLKEYISDFSTYSRDGGYYYFLVKYDNSEEKPMILPYSVDIVYNKDDKNNIYTGDYIKYIVESNNSISIAYVIGAVFSDNTFDIQTCHGGTAYYETYNYSKSVEGLMDVDGFTDIKYWYNSIDFDSKKTYVFSEELNLNRYANTTDIEQLVVGDVWKTDGSVINTPLIKEDYLLGVSSDASVFVDVEIDRGNAAAFQSHLRLMEANTFQDLEEIGNNFYFNE